MSQGRIDPTRAINAKVPSGGGFKGLVSPDGHTHLTLAPADGKFHGLYAPDGSMYYTLSPGTGFVGMYAPDGSRYVTTNANEISGALFVKFN